MKIIFLDIDGVLNSFAYRKQKGMQYYSEIVDSRKMPLLKAIVNATDAKIVLSTSWRKFWNEGTPQLDSVGEYINETFAQYGLSVYSKTPALENVGRSAEIKAWLDGKNYVDGYVILDDQQFGWTRPLRMHLIQTDRAGDGLDNAQVQEAIDLLNRKQNLAAENVEKGKIGLTEWLKNFWCNSKQ